ncbi:MAG: AAA family ATPase, partial [Ruminococcus sp.]
ERDPITNIVDIDQADFDDVLNHLDANLFGNQLFKRRLKEELTKYRVFNRIGQQPIFSVLICGASGIGKTEVARLLHQKLAADEPIIKINFGNYSAQDALNSLIGSPRGYIGSNKGELPDKLMCSRSKVILIDEFEKASKSVYNFFLQLLEEGKFTDSLGREYDLNKYIIIFTSNMPKEKIGEYLPPELRSRFSYKCAFWPLSTDDKNAYVEFKTQHYLTQIKNECCNVNKDLIPSDVVKIDVTKYSNMRDINSEIMRQITEQLYTQIVDIKTE